jgi:hypothetical protein
MFINFSVGTRLGLFSCRECVDERINFLPERKLFYKISRLNAMKDEKDVERKDAQITGRTEGPFGSDGSDVDRQMQDNQNTFEQENSANGLDSEQVRGGQDGRNIRPMGGIDMDSKNGVIRMGDITNSTMEVTEEGMDTIAADAAKTNTAMVDVTTQGPDDYASADQVPTPKAQEAAKHQSDRREPDETEQQKREDDVAETGTDLANAPTY